MNVRYERLQGYKGKKPKTGQKFCAEHGWLFLIRILDYGILCTYCKKIILVNTGERGSPHPAFKTLLCRQS